MRGTARREVIGGGDRGHCHLLSVESGETKAPIPRPKRDGAERSAKGSIKGGHNAVELLNPGLQRGIPETERVGPGLRRAPGRWPHAISQHRPQAARSELRRLDYWQAIRQAKPGPSEAPIAGRVWTD
jgi:hypothetical protein